jgi:filamentous hemagglutinin
MLSFWQGILPVLPAQAQTPPLPLTAHPQAPAGLRPLIDAARNGVPIVMIAPPSAAGVSRNQFNQFNVNANGLILGNNTAVVQTQLGGWISPNLQLGLTPARIILNEVLASDPSRLKGTIEVAGQRANIVIANPNGIECDGCGFLNTAGRATLTTGRPQFGSDGALQGFDVQRGELNIGAAGLSAGNLEQLDLLARGLVIEGEIWTSNLQILAGANQVLYANLQALPGAAAGDAPRFAIDIKDLGGMYANQIRVVATEQGLGVNSTGRMAALQGNLQLSANGDLTLKDSYAQGSMAMRSARDVSLTGQTQSQGALQIDAGAGLRQAGELETLGPLSLNAGSFHNSNAIIARSGEASVLQVAGAASNSGVIFSGGNLRLNADRISDRGGRLVANGELVLGAQMIDLADSTIEAGGNVSLQALGGRVDSRNTRISATHNLVIDAADALAKQGGQWLAGGAISLQGSSVSNVAGGVQAGGALSINTTGAIDNAGGKLLGAQVTLNGAGLVNDSGVIASDNAIQISTSGALSNRGGTLQAVNGMDISSQGHLNNAAGEIWSGKALALAVGDLNNDSGKIVAHDRANIDSSRTSNIGGLISAEGALGLRTGSLDNSRAEISSGGVLTIDTRGQALKNISGRLLASGDIDVQAGDVTSKAGALIASANNIQMQASSLNNDGSRISADTSKGIVRIALGSGDFSNDDGGISGAALVQVNAGRFSNRRGQILSDIAVGVSAASVDNSGGTISALQALDIASQTSINNSAGRLLSDVDAAVKAAAIDNTDGVVSAARTRLALGSGSLVNTGGQLTGAQTLTLESGAIINRSGKILTDGALTLDTQGQNLDNAGGVIRSTGALNLTGAALDNAAGQLSSNAAINISSQTLDNTGGELGTAPNSGGAISIDTHGQALRNDAGAIFAQGDLSISAGVISNRAVNGVAGFVASAGQARIDAISFDNSGGIVQAGQDLHLIAAGDVRNADGDIRATGNVVSGSASLDNSGGRIGAGLSASIVTGTLRNDAGASITAIGALHISADASSNQDGSLRSNSSVKLNLGSMDNRGGEVASGGELRLASAGQAVDNTGGLMLAQGAMTLRTGALNNVAGRIVSGAALDIDSDGLSNRDAFIGANGKLKINSSTSLDNSQGTIKSGSELTLNAGELSNAGGSLSAVGSAVIDVGSSAVLDNRGGTIVATRLDIFSGALSNNAGGLIGASGDLAINTRGQSLDNDHGNLQGDASLDVRAGNTSNIGGRMLGGQQVRLNSSALDNTSGEITSAGAVGIDTARGSLQNTAGHIVGISELKIDAGALRNDAGGVLGSKQDVTLSLASLNNDGGQLLAGGVLDLQAVRVSNRAAGIIGAGNDIRIDTSSFDNAGGLLQAGRDLQFTGSGALTNKDGSILAGGEANLVSGSFSNDDGVLASRLGLTLDSGTASNAGGQIQSGADAKLSLDSFNNGSGQLVAAGNIKLTSGVLMNDAQGLIGANKTLNILAGVTSNQNGIMTSVGGTTLSTTALNNRGGEISSASIQDIDTNGRQFDNAGGRLLAQGALSINAAELINTNGQIASDMNLNLNAANIANGGGVISSNASLTVDLSGQFNNADGVLQAAGALNLQAGATGNVRGKIAAGGNLGVNNSGAFDNSAGKLTSMGALTVDLHGQDLLNHAGSVVGGTGADIQAGSLRNAGGVIGTDQNLSLRLGRLANDDGAIQAGNDLRIASSGEFASNGGLIAAGRDAILGAASMLNGPKGGLTAVRDLQLTVAGELRNSGTLQSGRDAMLRAGALRNDQGELLSKGAMQILANGAVSNAEGWIAAQDMLGIYAAGLDNTRGNVVGNGNVTLGLGTAALLNHGGAIGSGGVLKVVAGSINNRSLDCTDCAAGQIVGTTGLSISSGAFDNSGALIASKGDVVIDTHGQDLLNSSGTIRTEGKLDLTAGRVMNRAAAAGASIIAAKQTLAINAEQIDNDAGMLSGGTGLTLIASGALINDVGAILSDASASVRAASLSNRAQGKISAADGLAIETGSGAIDNADGAIVSGHALINSGALDNTRGVIAAKLGDLNIKTQGRTFNNDSGRLQAKQNLILNSGVASNRSGIISAQEVSFTSSAFDNGAGKIIAVHNLTGNTRTLNNSAGLLQSGGDLKLDTNGQLLVNADSGATGGILSAGALDIVAGSLDNRSGVIASIGNTLISVSSVIDNSRGGLISSGADSSIKAAGINNFGARIEAARDLKLSSSGLLDNRAGSLIALGDISMTAAKIDNSANGLIDAYNVNAVSGLFSNAGGTVNAAKNITIKATELDNTGGSVSAAGVAQVMTNTFKNDLGHLVGGNELQVATSSAAPGGVMESKQNLTLTVNGDYDNTASLSAQENLSIIAANIRNSGTLKAGDTFTANTGNLFNSGGIEAVNNRITAAGTLTNTGLIDAADNRITAAVLDNVGSGRIYGGAIDGSGQLQVNAARIANSAGASIMSRSAMALSGQTLDNGIGSLIYSLGDMQIKALQSLTNDGARIESSRNLTINSANILNRNAGLTTRVVTQAPVDKVLVQPSDSSKQYPIELCTGIGGGQDKNACIEHPEKYGQRSVLAPIYSGGETVCMGGDDGSCSTNPVTTNYAWNAPQFAQFGITPTPAPPAEPGGAGACSMDYYAGGDNGGYVTVEVNSAPCNQWRTNYATWNTDFTTQLLALGSKIEAYNAEVNEDNRVFTFEDYTVFRVTETTSKTEVASSAPAQIFSGGDLTLIGSTVNRDSQIVAGGAVKIIAGSPVLNLASQGTRQTTYQGTEQFSHVDTCGNFYDEHHCRNTDSLLPYNPAPTIDPPFDLLEVRVISGENRSANQAPSAGSSVNVPAIPASGTTIAGQSQGAINTIVGSAIAAAYHVSQDRLSSMAIGQPDAPNQVALHNPVAGTPVGSQASGAVAVNPPDGASAANIANLVGTGPPLPAAIAITAMPPPHYVKQTSPSLSPANATPSSAVQASKALNAGRLPFTVQSVAAPGDTFVRTAMTSLVAPTASVYRIHSEPGARYLVETDPQFTQRKSFISSDYFLQQLQRDPERQLKRYGDGFYEQQQVNDQILALTGRRFITGYSSTESEFKALMDAGVAYAREFQLTPGVSLSAQQMALLTTDIVWLTEQTVTLANGQTEQVLVPQVYLRRARDGDLQQSGTLIAGTDVFISSEQGIVNIGSIQAERSTTLLAGQDLLNAGGRISGQDVLLRANNDLLNLSGTIQGRGNDSTIDMWAGRDLVLQTVVTDSSNADGSSTRSNIGRIATVQGGSVLLGASRDLNIIGGALSAQTDLTAIAGRDLKVSAVEGRYQISVYDKNGPSVQGRTGFINDSSVSNTVATLSAGKDLSLGAVNLLALQGANLNAANDLLIQGGKVDIAAVRDRVSTDIQTIGKKEYSRIAASDETLAGGNVQAGRNLTLNALGTNELTGDIDIKGAYLSSKEGALSLIAKDNISIAALTTAHSSLTEQYSKSGNLLGTKTTTTASSSSVDRIEGSVVSGNSITMRADVGDIRVAGSSVVGDALVNMDAGRNITLESAAQTSAQQNSREQKTSGLFSNGGASITLGKREIAQQRGAQASEQIGSSVASLEGDVRLNAGEGYTQMASQVIAQKGDIDIVGKFVDINAASNDSSTAQQDRSKQGGLTLALSTPILSALQTIEKTANAAGNTSDPRMQALAAATIAMNAKDAIGMAQAGGKNLDVTLSLTLGGSRSESNQASTSSTVSTSTVAAGNDVSIKATGAGTDSHLTVRGSEVQAGNRASLSADGAINLLAAQNTAGQQSTSKSSSAGVGGALTFGTDGMSAGVTANASASKSKADGSDASWTNTHVTAGNVASTSSGTDTTLKGAVVSANQVETIVGTTGKGDLTIQSLQDTSNYQSRDQSMGGSVTVGAGFAVSASTSRGKVDAEYASVTEQAGIKAGDGGFVVSVKGNTDLQGGVIGSSQGAVDQSKNSLTTASLTRSDIQNIDRFEASSIGVSVALSSKPTTDTKQGEKSTVTDPGSAGFTSVPGAGAGIGSASGNQASTTNSGISGAAISITNEAQQKALTGQDAAATIAGLAPGVTTSSTTGALVKSWSGQQLKQEVDAQRDITQAFSQAAPKAVASYADSKLAEAAKLRGQAETLLAQADKESDPTKRAALNQQSKDLDANWKDVEANWKEGGMARVALHTAVGAVSGGLGGAAGAAVTSAAAPKLDELQAGVQAALVGQGVSDEAAKVIAQGFGAVTALGMGGVVGGVAGAASGLTTDVNNRQLHPNEKARIKQLAGQDAEKEARLTAAACAMAKCYAEYPVDSAAYQQLKQLADMGASDALAGERQQLSSQTGMFGYTTTGLLSDKNIDAAKQLNNTYQVGTRTLGAGQMVLGGLGVASSVVTAPVSCATGIGCVANAVVGTFSLDATYAGAKQAVSGNPENTFFNQGLQGLGMSPEAAGLVEAALGIGSAAKVGSIANMVPVTSSVVRNTEGVSRLAGSGKVATGAEISGANTGGAANRVSGVPDALVPDADFAGRGAVRVDLADHLINADVLKKQISGGHNVDNFMSTVNAAGGTITARVEVAPGIYQLEYQLPGAAKAYPKTVYDPKIFPDAVMADMANTAASKALIQYQLTGITSQKVVVNGVEFTVPVRIQNGQPYVPTAYPVGVRK